MVRKQGFTMPIGQWLERGDYRDLFQDTLHSHDCIFSRRVIDRLFSGLKKGHANGERLFALTLFELWRDAYSVSF
jgi:asparagine synthase (glutamine-hydrolysing)